MGRPTRDVVAEIEPVTTFEKATCSGEATLAATWEITPRRRPKPAWLTRSITLWMISPALRSMSARVQ